MKKFTLRPPRLRGEVSESFFTTEYQWIQRAFGLTARRPHTEPEDLFLITLKCMVYKPQDTYYKKAKQEGYRSRAAYKLLELQKRFALMRAGDIVVDLGAAPGGWLQVAAKLAGRGGKVIGIDLQPIASLREANIICLQGDITSEETSKKIQELVHGKVDCVLSDLAPRLSGIRDADMARCLELNRTALALAIDLLRPGGSLLAKSFVNQELQTYTREIKRHFQSVQRTRPEATRQGSSEFYFFAKGFHGNPI